MRACVRAWPRGPCLTALVSLQLVKLCSGMMEAGKAYVGASRLFVGGIRDLSQHCQKDQVTSVRLRPPARVKAPLSGAKQHVCLQEFLEKCGESLQEISNYQTVSPRAPGGPSAAARFKLASALISQKPSSRAQVHPASLKPGKFFFVWTCLPVAALAAASGWTQRPEAAVSYRHGNVVVVSFEQRSGCRPLLATLILHLRTDDRFPKFSDYSGCKVVKRSRLVLSDPPGSGSALREAAAAQLCERVSKPASGVQAPLRPEGGWR